MDRNDALELALGVLRERLREGAFPPGSHVPASRIAEELGLSATPVREALSRLAGEGLVEERRHQGFFVRTLNGLDVADLYRMSLVHLSLAHGQRGSLPLSRPGEMVPSADPVQATEQLFLTWIAETGSGPLMGFFTTLATQLGPVRRLEPLVLEGLDTEAAELLALRAPELAPRRGAVLRRFHGRRIAAADRLSGLVNRRNHREGL